MPSRSCRASPDTVQEDFMKSALQIFLIVSPPGTKIQGRSRSLTHIDNLDPAMLLRNEDMDSRSEPDTSRDQLLLDVPSIPGVETREHRRKKLARSQVPSSEFFSVSFEGELGSGLEEFFPVSRGTCLGDALRPLLEKKGINISSVNIFVDSSKTPLPSPGSTDTYFVAGKNLTVKVKDNAMKSGHQKFHSRSFKQPSRKSSSPNRGKHKFFSSSTEDQNNCSDLSTLGSSTSLEPTAGHNSNQHAVGGSISHEGSLKVKSTGKQSTRWSGLFSNSKDNSKMDLLVEQLNSYSEYGTPKPSFLPSCDENDALYTIEKDWKNVVPSWKDMNERSIQQQTAIWELVETEVVYLKTIKVITDLFLACLYNLQTSNILNEIDRDQLFSNIPEIYKSNNVLWLECILPMVQKSRSTKQPLDPNDLGNGFLHFGTICQPYTKYCLDQTNCQRYCREKYQDNEYFKAYLAWCETRKECNRLRLMDILVRPMQRMTKYSLLLKAILKHTDDLEQRKCLDEMISSVEKFVRSVNGALRNRQDADKVQGIAERIEAYDVVETREDELESLVKLHSKLDLFQPMPGCFSRRWLIFDVDVKIKDAFTSKMDAHCFIFTDMILICKPVGRKGERMKVIRQPYIVDRLILKELSKDACSFALVYLNEYGTASAALSLHFNEPKLVKVTMDHIKKAQKIYNEVKEKEHLEIHEGDDENGAILYLNYHLGGSSRASQLSSLVHSHSGSVEMNEASVLSSQAVSFEHELRGSSLSSDDGNANESSGVNLVKSRSLSTETGRPTSPRRERRFFLSKSPSPNTLTVQIPVPNLSGQSLPNLSSASDSSPPTYYHHSLTVPKSLLSPTHRGVSYPPPSPRSLTRSYAVLQSRNPPLQKSKNIIGPSTMNHEKAVSLDVQVPEIRGTALTSERDAGIEQLSQQLKNISAAPYNNAKSNAELRRPKEFLPTSALDEQVVGDPEYRFTHYDCPSPSDSSSGLGNLKRLARNDRPDSKRYYTAGAIEEMKKENVKDAAIHKRLSWNCGPHQQNPQHQQSLQRQYEVSMPPSTQFFCNESMTSVRSSSGVSSTSSLLNCNSDIEQQSSSSTSTNPFLNTISTNVVQYAQSPPGASPQQHEQPQSTKQLPDVRICEPGESDRTILFNNNSNNEQLELQEISDHIEKHFVEGSPCQNCSNHKQQQQFGSPQRSKSLTNPSPNPIARSPPNMSGESSSTREQHSCLDKLRDLVLSDTTIQTSDV